MNWSIKTVMADHLPADKNRPPFKRPGRNLTVALFCAGFVGLMVGAAYAAVPLYDLFCKVTGYGGTTRVAASGADRVIDRRFIIRFDGNVAGGLPWSFDAERREISLRAGETGMMNYDAVNVGTAANAGSATFNVTPFAAGSYFNKIDCFCFSRQDLAAGQALKMPVVFYVDPAIADDPALDSVTTITLSYTFFPADPPGGPLAVAPASVKSTDNRL